MKTSTLSLLTAFVSAALVSLVGAQDSKEKAQPDNNSAQSAEGKDASVPTSQKDFLRTAAHKGLADVKCAQLALAKSENPKVRELAAALAKDHSAANEELKEIAGKMNVSVTDEVDDKTKKQHAEMEKKSGKDFDTAFLNGLAASHRKSIELFEQGAKVSDAEAVLTFIEKTLPVLRGHAQKVKNLGGVDEEAAALDSRQSEAPRSPQAPEKIIPGPR